MSDMEKIVTILPILAAVFIVFFAAIQTYQMLEWQRFNAEWRAELGLPPTPKH